METKGIDLTKCNNLRYRAKVDGNNDYGRICVENADTGLAFLRSDLENGYIATWHCDAPTIEGICGRKVTDFEIVPRDPETYKGWQVGDRARNPRDNWSDSAYKEIIFRSGELVICKDGNGDISGGYTCGQLHRLGYRLVLTDIEKQIIKKKKKYEPQDGDIVAWKDKEDGGRPALSIYREKNWSYMTLFTNGTCCVNEASLTMKIVRPATDEEKQKLSDAMAKQGKRWNAEKKVVEDIPKPHEFKKGEPVLVRTEYGRDWKLGAYVELSSIPDAQFGKYGVTDGRVTLFYRFCLPYNERTMHLLGTSEDYKEGE